jgi:hypothetical protein
MTSLFVSCFHVHRESSTLTNEFPEESDHFRFLRASYFAHLKGAVGLIMGKASDVPFPRFIKFVRVVPNRF